MYEVEIRRPLDDIDSELMAAVKVMLEWCDLNLSGKYSAGNMRFTLAQPMKMVCLFEFELEEDIVAFKLRWL